MIPYGRQSIDQADIDAVVAVLQSDFLTQGPQVPRFEETVADYCGAKHAVAVNSATSALHIACLALGLNQGDMLWTSPNSFVASANCGLYCGAQIDFVDIDLSTGNICPKALAEKLEAAAKNDSLPKVLVVVHFAGQPCDMEAIHTLCSPLGIKIIEDASHAIGSRYRDAVTGSCRFSDITVFSFHPVKVITSAEGGMAVTNNDSYAKQMRLYRSHGITRAPEDLKLKQAPAWHYEQQMLGFNYRMTDIQAALGNSQMRHLDNWIAQRNQLAKNYQEKLQALGLNYLQVAADTLSAYHLFMLVLPENKASEHRSIFEELKSRGIGVNLHYTPIHLQPYYQEMGFQSGDFPIAEAYASRAITLPLYPELTEQQQDYVIDTLADIMGQ
ncbi:UDP-4-amino-4,6-dideoxy-N-acetyl-beta-L-altrosamine transaminase [Corallincola platygyrae]|uniref:UDP-4-amino-4, 6-dideoxy-N-acetyl-beta-L-altrosamine transaminase n=1 Tax=Corallincola platygyrae TaxID=1193278 RepID=A0ABW4XHT0_9GAMM